MESRSTLECPGQCLRSIKTMHGGADVKKPVESRWTSQLIGLRLSTIKTWMNWILKMTVTAGIRKVPDYAFGDLIDVNTKNGMRKQIYLGSGKWAPFPIQAFNLINQAVRNGWRVHVRPSRD